MKDLLVYFARARAALHQSSYFLLLASAFIVFWAFRPSTRVETRPQAEKKRSEEFVLVVEKHSQRAMLYCDGSLLTIHRCAVGRSPSAETPSGAYTIKQVFRDEHYRPGFVLNLPDAAQARRWLAAKQIDRAVYNEILASAKQGASQTIEILGGGGQQGQWPAGYIVLDDSDLERLAPFMRPGTRVMIR